MIISRRTGLTGKPLTSAEQRTGLGLAAILRTRSESAKRSSLQKDWKWSVLCDRFGSDRGWLRYKD